MIINNENFNLGHERTSSNPVVARERFTPTEKSSAFLKECRGRGYDISTIINLALETFEPKTRNNCFTWEGIEDVVKGKKKWF